MNKRRHRSTAVRIVLGLLATTVATAVAAAAVLAAEVAYTVSQDYLPASSAPTLPPAYGDPAAPPLRLAVLGDSTGAGLGATTADSTVAGALALRLAQNADSTYSTARGSADPTTPGPAAGRRVHLRALAVSGARVGDLVTQLAQLDRAGGADLAVVLIGANDATHLTRLPDVRRDLRDAVTQLRERGARVVVGTCPDLGGARAFPQPLRELAAARGRAVAGVQRAAVAEAGGVSVDLAALTGPAFRADPGTLSSDRFHPSDRGYALWVDALSPTVLAEAPPPAASDPQPSR